MTHKILHIIAVLFTALAAALILPRFCKNNRSYFSHLYSEAVYSEILQDFILSHYEYTRENGQIKAFTAYRDTRGNAIDYKALDSLCPLNNAAQLAFENRFPDTICGQEVTPREAEEAVFRHRISAPSLDYGLYDLIDRYSYRSQKFNTQDLMRFTQEGIEFILPESNRIDTVKSGLFNRALAQNDFVPPMTRIWSPANRTDLEQQGFFLNDSKGNLFRLSMSEGAPVVEPLNRPDDKEILLMSFCDEEDFLAIAVTTDGDSYLLPRDRSGYSRLPLPSFLGKSVSLSGNLFYYFFTLESDDTIRRYRQIITPRKQVHDQAGYSRTGVRLLGLSFPGTYHAVGLHRNQSPDRRSCQIPVREPSFGPTYFLHTPPAKIFRGSTTHRHNHRRTVRHLRNGGSIRHSLPPQR